jgi:hypothetical protein
MTDTHGAPEPGAREPRVPDRGASGPWPPAPAPGSLPAEPPGPWPPAPAPGSSASPSGQTDPWRPAPGSRSYPAPSAVPPATWPPPAAPAAGYGAPPAAGSGPAPTPGGFATSPVPWSATEAPPRRRGPGRWLTIILVTVLGLAGIAGGGLALTRELGRGPTHAEVQAALRQEIAGRWQHLPAGKIFPARVTYQDAETLKTTARRVGIARPVPCRSALDPKGLSIAGGGCRTVLRATYVDASGTMVATVGVVVMPAAPAASSALSRLEASSGARHGLLPLPFRGTIAGQFRGARLRAAVGAQAAGPYLLLFAVGSGTGEPGHAGQRNEDLAPLGFGVLSAVSDVLAGHGQPCQLKDISC